MSTVHTVRDRARRDEQRFTLVRLLVVLAILLFGVAAASGSAFARATYRVRPGDTLSGIAAAHGLTVSELARLNRLDPQGLLLAGTTLRLTRPSDRARVRYRVRLGDTLSGIAARYDTSVARLARLNRIDPAGLLPAGAKLLVPLAAGTPRRRPARAAARTSVQASILRWAAHYGVDGELARALAWVESGDQPYVSSPVGAWGVMQVMPATWSYVETVLIGSRSHILPTATSVSASPTFTTSCTRSQAISASRSPDTYRESNPCAQRVSCPRASATSPRCSRARRS